MKKNIFYKNVSLLFIVFVLIAALCGCNSDKETSNSNKYNATDFGMHDSKTNTTVYLNDSRSTVEKYWGNKIVKDKL